MKRIDFEEVTAEYNTNVRHKIVNLGYDEVNSLLKRHNMPYVWNLLTLLIRNGFIIKSRDRKYTAIKEPVYIGDFKRMIEETMDYQKKHNDKRKLLLSSVNSSPNDVKVSVITSNFTIFKELVKKEVDDQIIKELLKKL